MSNRHLDSEVERTGNGSGCGEKRMSKKQRRSSSHCAGIFVHRETGQAFRFYPDGLFLKMFDRADYSEEELCKLVSVTPERFRE